MVWWKKRSKKSKKGVKGKKGKKRSRGMNHASFSKVGSQIVSDRTLTKLKLTLSGASATVAAGSSSWIDLIANGPYAPTSGGSGAGLQPMGYDQWVKFYRYYRVYGAKVDFSVSPVRLKTPGGIYDAAGDAKVVIVPDRNATFTTNFVDAMQTPYAKYKQCGMYSNQTRLKMYMSTEKMFGLNKKTVETNTDFWADATSATPVYKWYYHLGVSNQDGTNQFYFNYSYTITFYVEFFGRIGIIDQ